jgi:hypothetical protein
MADTFISWNSALDIEAYRLALAQAKANGDRLRVGTSDDPAPADTPSESLSVLISPRQTDSPRRWLEALQLAQQTGRQVFVTSEGGEHHDGVI